MTVGLHDPWLAAVPVCAELQYLREYSKTRRDANRADGRCINASRSGRGKVQHGEVVRGGRCQRCLDVKRGGK